MLSAAGDDCTSLLCAVCRRAGKDDTERNQQPHVYPASVHSMIPGAPWNEREQ